LIQLNIQILQNDTRDCDRFISLNDTNRNYRKSFRS